VFSENPNILLYQVRVMKYFFNRNSVLCSIFYLKIVDLSRFIIDLEAILQFKSFVFGGKLSISYSFARQSNVEYFEYFIMLTYTYESLAHILNRAYVYFFPLRLKCKSRFNVEQDMILGTSEDIIFICQNLMESL
jgi:hypothetical protein